MESLTYRLADQLIISRESIFHLTAGRFHLAMIIHRLMGSGPKFVVCQNNTNFHLSSQISHQNSVISLNRLERIVSNFVVVYNRPFTQSLQDSSVLLCPNILEGQIQTKKKMKRGGGGAVGCCLPLGNILLDYDHPHYKEMMLY